MTIKASTKFIVGQKAIMGYLQISRPLFDHFMKIGLPVATINGRQYAHADNLDDWCRNTFRGQATITIPEDLPK